MDEMDLKYQKGNNSDVSMVDISKSMLTVQIQLLMPKQYLHQYQDILEEIEILLEFTFN